MRANWVAAAGLLAACASAAEPAPRTQQEKLSYAMGVSVARTVQRQGVDVDVDAYARGLRDALAGEPLAFTDEELRAAMAGVLADVKAKAAAVKDRKAAGEAFLAENGKKEGVVTLPSGLQYKVLEAGDGKRPTDADAIVCNYRGTLVDGKELDSSSDRGKPATLHVARLIPGFREAVKLMPVGSRWQIWMPPELGYGARGGSRRSKIGRNEALALEVQLLGIRAPPAPATTTTAAAP